MVPHNDVWRIALAAVKLQAEISRSSLKSRAPSATSAINLKELPKTAPGILNQSTWNQCSNLTGYRSTLTESRFSESVFIETNLDS